MDVAVTFEDPVHILVAEPWFWARLKDGVAPPPWQATYEVNGGNAVFWMPAPGRSPTLDCVEGWATVGFLVAQASETELPACEVIGNANEGLHRHAPGTTSSREGDMVSFGAGNIRNTGEYGR